MARNQIRDAAFFAGSLRSAAHSREATTPLRFSSGQRAPEHYREKAPRERVAAVRKLKQGATVSACAYLHHPGRILALSAKLLIVA